ncbi:hypothetical protein C900_04086 [Fulvivirga imtechensis AK7]|uniref:ABC transporter permease n=1 Tax=Fulvivirga imtechensis AK7 TaxID=1237149 RepID=L8JRH0_9BACT|nr:ABC transporter permease [Fulvivirga imtechensis]ELR70089.1 hypothetical protein C900_04086 [Fulvivirga imtechensis AK7]
MLINYLKTTLRNLLRNKTNSFINIFGLSLGITCSLVLFLLVTFLLSYDQYHDNYERIYRIVNASNDQHGNRVFGNGVPPPMPDAVRADIPGIDKLVFISNKYGNNLIGVESKELNEWEYFEEDEGVAYTESNYFGIFTRPLLQGNFSALDEPNKVILSEKLAWKYFGDVNVMGRDITLDKKETLQVAGIMEDVPRNSDFPFEMLISYATIKNAYEKHGWGSVSSDDQIYLLLEGSTSVEHVNNNLQAFKEKQYPDDNNELTYFLQPLKDLHFDKRFNNYRYSTVSHGNILTMALVAFFIIATACINFINISTAVAVKRSKEVGVRKVLGSSRGQLIKQFLGETFLIVVLAIVVSLGLAELLLIYLNPFLEIDMAIKWLNDGKIELFLLSTLIIVTIMAGLYPSIVMAKLKPAVIIKNKWANMKTSGLSLRKMLVAFQFIITPFFIIGTLVLIAQMKFLRESDMGFKTDAIIVMKVPDSEVLKKKALKSSIERLSGVRNVSLASTTPLSGSISVTDIELDNDEKEYYMDVKWADENYLDMYDIGLIAGEGLHAVDTMNRVVVNEEFLKLAGISDPQEAIGRMVHIWHTDVPITGVVQNFYSRNMRVKLEPLMLVNGLGKARTISVKLTGQNLHQQLEDIKKEWHQVYPEYAFDYKFADDVVASMYDSEEEMATVFTFFSCIAILIGCLGLFGLVSFTTNQKVKEIGIRKALGASVQNILSLVSRDFITPVMIGFIIAAPLGWYLMDLWLQNYQYKINLGAGIFLIALAATFTIAIVTTGYKSLKAASANPVDSLRDE